VWFDKALLSVVEGLTTNGIKYLPFVLSLSKPVLSEAEGDLFSAS
jgi:hypothetical protein